MKKLPVFAVLFILLILTPLFLNVYYNSQLKPVSNDTTSQIFVIKPGQGPAQIGENLKEEGLIRNALAFRLYVSQSGIAKTIQAGDFRISPNQSTKEIAQLLTHGAIDVWITFPEGTRKEEMAAILESKLKTSDNEGYIFDKKEFISKADEGHLFPDTYLIPKDAATADVIARLTSTFDQKVDKATLSKGVKNGLTQEEVITLASLIEREAITNEERPIIAGILLNRINAGIALQVDATVQYAKGYDSAKNSWWPTVTQEDYTAVKSLYNTYLHQGLPPTPICNPGVESIRAAAEPAETEYLYYLHDSDGKIHYAKTIEEHTENIQNFL